MKFVVKFIMALFVGGFPGKFGNIGVWPGICPDVAGHGEGLSI